MARCGRCGLLEEDSGLGNEIAGHCLWYRMDVPKDAAWEHRQCIYFHKKLQAWTAKQHWDFTRDRTDMSDSYRASQRAIFFSVTSLGLSILSFILSVWG